MTLKNIIHFINYKLTAYTEHDVHSPFVFDFYNELILNNYPYNDFFTLNAVRQALLKDETIIDVTDYGAGSRKLKTNQRQVSDIAKMGISNKKQSEFFYRLINKFKPHTIIELGTSLGLNTLYLAKAAPQSTIYTMEGCANIHQYAQGVFNQCQQNNIKALQGNFNTELPALLKNLDTIDLLYVDGNHAYEPTVNYFKLALEKKNANSIFIFDDINWSDDMQKAWKEIYSHPEVTLSLDFFYFGIVFFRKESLQKEHFVLRF